MTHDNALTSLARPGKFQSAAAALEEASAGLDRARREREELDGQLQRARQRLEDAAAANAARRTELRGLDDAVAAARVGAEAQRARLEAEAEALRRDEAALRAEVERVRSERAEAEARRSSLRDEAKRAREEKVPRRLCLLPFRWSRLATERIPSAESPLTCGGRDPQEAAEKAARARLSEVERLRRLHAGLDGREAAQVGLCARAPCGHSPQFRP